MKIRAALGCQCGECRAVRGSRRVRQGWCEAAGARGCSGWADGEGKPLAVAAGLLHAAPCRAGDKGVLFSSSVCGRGAQRTEVSPELMVYISVYFGVNHTCKYQPLPIIKPRVCFSVVLSALIVTAKERLREEELTPALSPAERGKVRELCACGAVPGKVSTLPTAPYFPFTLCGVDERPWQGQQRDVGSGVWFAERI